MDLGPKWIFLAVLPTVPDQEQIAYQFEKWPKKWNKL